MWRMPVQLISKYKSTAIRSPEEVAKDDLSSDSKPEASSPLSASVQPDSCEERIEPSENDFDLEPAEPAELAEPTETIDTNTEPIAQREEETPETDAMTPCDD